MTAIANERSVVQFGTMMSAGDEIRAMGITLAAKSAQFFTVRSKGVADIFLDLFRDGSRVFV